MRTALAATLCYLLLAAIPAFDKQAQSNLRHVLPFIGRGWDIGSTVIKRGDASRIVIGIVPFGKTLVEHEDAITAALLPLVPLKLDA